MRLEWCEAPPEESGRPCICGATVKGDDPVHGVCQSRRNRARPIPDVYLVLVDKETDEIVACTPRPPAGVRLARPMPSPQQTK